MNFFTHPNSRMFTGSLHLAGVAVILLTLGGFYGLVYQPLQRRQAEHRARTEQLKQLLVNTGTEAVEYRDLSNRLSKMKKTVENLHRQLADHASETMVIEELSGIAAEVNLEVLDYQVGLTKSLPTHSQTEVDFRCHGSYASICRFLEKAEHLTRTTKLSKFELKSEKNSRSYPIQMTFVLYFEGKSHDTKEGREIL